MYWDYRWIGPCLGQATCGTVRLVIGRLVWTIVSGFLYARYVCCCVLHVLFVRSFVVSPYTRMHGIMCVCIKWWKSRFDFVFVATPPHLRHRHQHPISYPSHNYKSHRAINVWGVMNSRWAHIFLVIILLSYHILRQIKPCSKLVPWISDPFLPFLV